MLIFNVPSFFSGLEGWGEGLGAVVSKDMSCDAKKTSFRVSDKFKHKPACTVTVESF